MAEEQAIVKKPGTALLKSEFLVHDRVWEVNTDFIAKKDKREHEDAENKDGILPPDQANKKRLKGQNKQRPWQRKAPKGEKLCYAIGRGEICPFGDTCSYTHDILGYLSNKPKDISDTCYLFEKFGKCNYSLTCRFASKHIENEKNIVNEELWNKCKDAKSTVNSLSHELQTDLRKRKYDFRKSYNVLKAIDENRRQRFARPNNDMRKIDFTAEVPVENFQNPAQEAKMCSTNNNSAVLSTDGSMEIDADYMKLRPCERKTIDFKNKLYLAPLTTVGNLPFRRICKEFGADITCGEMAMSLNILQGSYAEWALLKRHYTEDVFGVQLCGAHTDTMTKCAQMLSEKLEVDFIDINMGCPIDFVYRSGAGSGLMNRYSKLEDIIHGMSSVIDVPLTIKMRTGIYTGENLACKVISKIHNWNHKIDLITIHGRSKEQRYTKTPNWDYIDKCAELAKPIPVFGGGDILSYEDYNLHLDSNVSGVMIARGALIKPWIFTEIKEQKHIDISSSERFDILKNYVNYGFEHWGSDSEGVEKTRRFLLEWLSFLYRYIPVGVLEQLPQKINERPPPYVGRNDLETLMASPSCSDWVKISEMLLGPVPEEFVFLPKHKANAYQ